MTGNLHSDREALYLTLYRHLERLSSANIALMSVLRQCGVLISRQQHHAVINAFSLLAPISTGFINRPLNNVLWNSRGHKNFGHKEEKTPNLTKIFHFVVGSLVVISLLDFKKLKKMLTPKVDADAGVEYTEISQKRKNTETIVTEDRVNKQQQLLDEDDDNSENEESKEAVKATKAKKEKVGFRERKILEYEHRIRQFSTPDKVFRYFATVRLIAPEHTAILMTPDDFLLFIFCSGYSHLQIIEYENRIRQFSTPDKVFRYFATIQVPTADDRHEIFMTPVDFLTSMTPGMKHPEGLGLDQYKRYDPKSVGDCLNLKLEKDSIFYKLGSYGLITFSDYIFLLTVLSSTWDDSGLAYSFW
ncbi:hypothetical protein GQX74_002394 [Glossina fuscipes]|nr:hypothetical protein GQX74_002394 [Glossina fuscipes]